MNNNEIKNELLEELSSKFSSWLFSHRIINQGWLESLDDNNQIFNDLVAPALDEPEFIVWKVRDMNRLYIQYLGMHAFGIALYSELTKKELGSIDKLKDKIKDEDTYWLALDEANIKEGTKLEEDLYEFVEHSSSLVNRRENAVNDRAILISYMKSMFDAGLTFAKCIKK